MVAVVKAPLKIFLKSVQLKLFSKGSKCARSLFKKLFKLDNLFLYLLICLFGFSCLNSCVDHRTNDEAPVTIRKPRPRLPYKNDPWFEKYMIDTDGVGLHAQMTRSSDGLLGIAYWSTDGEEGEACVDLEVDDPPLEVRWDLKFAQWNEDSGWQSELVSKPLLLGNPPGLDLDYSANNQPLISALAGEAIPELRYCGGGNLTLFTPSEDPGSEEWNFEYVVETSNQAMSGDAASDFGFVVGYWPSLAQNRANKRMIVYQDVHGGSLQRDDLVRADLEVALQDAPNSAWRYEVIDLGEGAGIFNQALVTENGDYLALYYISFDAQQAERQRQGLWLAIRQEDGSWNKTLVYGGPTRGEPSLIAYKTGIAIAYYDQQARRPVLKVLSELNQFEDEAAWQKIMLGDLRYNEGHSPSLKMLPDGRLALVWYRCGPAEVEECRSSDDAVIFSYPDREQSGLEEGINEQDELLGDWVIEVVESGEEALCGFGPQLEIDAQEQIWVTWQCSRRSGTDGSFQYQLESAKREFFETL